MTNGTMADEIRSHLKPTDKAAIREQAEEVERLRRALRALVVAVTYADPPKDYGTPDEPNLCHEARVPTGFVTEARAALKQENSNG